MLWLTVLLLVKFSLCAPTVVELEVPLGIATDFESPNYPNNSPPGTHHIWKLKTDLDAKMDIVCDVKIHNSKECKDGYLDVSENGGNQFCSVVEGLGVTSTRNTIMVDFNLLKTSGQFKCNAKGVKNEVFKAVPRSLGVGEEKVHIDLKLGDPGYDKIFYKSLPRGMKKTWTFKTSDGAKLSLFCRNFKISNGARCKDEEMKVTSGDKTKQYCGQEYNLEFFSETSMMEVYLKTSNERGEINCIVQAISGPKKDQYMNVKSYEIDSREHGGAKGAKGTNCNCGWANKNKNAPRVVNGRIAQDHEFPWMAALLSYRLQFCGGSIISSRHVLTAAHCTQGKLAEDIQVLLGVNNWVDAEKGQLHQIERIMDNDYDKTNAHANDISVLLSKTSFQFSQNVGPVCLIKNQPNIDHKYVTLSGWGALGRAEGMRTPERLRTTHMRVVDFPTCNNIYFDRFDRDVPTRLCTWASNRDSCQGDSGGPLVWLDPETNRYTQMGLVSFGRGCNTDSPKINTLVSAYYDWIENRVKSTNGEICHKM